MSDLSKLRIVVLGYIIRGPLGGLVWHHLQYILGLRNLGHEVIFLEDSGDYPACYDPSRHVVDTDPTYGIQFLHETFAKFALENQWAYYDAHANRWLGPQGDKAIDTCRGADVVLNLSGVNPIRAWIEDIPVRVFVDTDPVFTQVRHIQDSAARAEAAKHTAFFTFGESFQSKDCGIPSDGLLWQPTRQPLVPEAWPVTPPPSDGYFTTVMQWDSYPEARLGDQSFGMKSKSFEAYSELPQRTGSKIEIAMGGPNVPRDELAGKGWRLADPLEVTRSACSYQKYIQQSLGEFTVAKHGYVASNSGWFSERSLSYLASGRPVITQDTGFPRHLPTGSGLLSFSSLDEAADALREVRSDYHAHCRAAREIAIEFFHFSKVLSNLLERAIDKPSPVTAECTRS